MTVTGPAPSDDLCPSRRVLLQRLGALGVTTIVAGVATGCSGDEPVAPASTPAPTPAATESALPSQSAAGLTQQPAEPSAGGEDGTESDADPAVSGIPTSQVPVGRAAVVDLVGQRAILAHPTKGRFVAFSARCTHQGTVVAVTSGLRLTCPSHGSQFDAADGSVRRGPAAQPLEAIAVTVRGDQVVPVAL
jgi:Rieske Fe-S protein